jgi:hypothetical protein
MKRGVPSLLRFAAVTAVAMGACSLLAYGQTSTSEPERELDYRQATPIEIPAPHAVTVTARPVNRGEIAIVDPIGLVVSPIRSQPEIVSPRQPHRLAVGAVRGWVPLEVPDPRAMSATVERGLVNPPLVSEPLAVPTVTERLAAPQVEIGNAIALPPILARRQLSALQIGEPEQVILGGQRVGPDVVAVTEPLKIGLDVGREPLSVADAEAAIKACDFETIREQLRYLVGASDQLDRAGHHVIAELSRLNRANAAFEAARLRYEEGKLDEAKTLLVAAEQTHCKNREKAVEEAIAKIERMSKVLAQIDGAIEACNIPAMTTQREQLKGQSHVLLVERRKTLDSLAQPAAIATDRSQKADAALSASRLEEARADLDEAERQLAQFPAQQYCLDLRERVAAQSAEVNRLTQLADSVDEAVAACDIDDMTKLSQDLANESNALLQQKKVDLDSVNGPATATRDAESRAAIPFDQGDLAGAETLLHEAEAHLAQIDQQLCSDSRQSVANKLAEIERIRTLMVEAKSAIQACSAADLPSLQKRLAEEKHVLLVGQRETVDRIENAVAAAQRGLDDARSLYENGDLDGSEAKARRTLDDLAAIEDSTTCEPMRAKLSATISDVGDLRSQLARADNAIAACEVPEMRALAGSWKDAKHVLLAAKRQALLDVSEPVAEASDLNVKAREDYLAGRTDEAEAALQSAAERLATVETCDPLKATIAARLDKIARLRKVLARVDEAVDACEIPAMTAMAAQLKEQSHPLLADRFTRVNAVNTPATAAEIARRQARKAYDAGDLKTARAQYETAARELEGIDPKLCDNLRDQVTSQLASIGEVEQLLARVDSAANACSLQDLRSIDADLQDRSYVLLAKAKKRTSGIVEPLAEAERAHADAKVKYEAGDLAEAEALQQRATRALNRIERNLCVDMRQQVAAMDDRIASVRKLLATADQTMAACRIDVVDQLSTQLASTEHRLLRSKQAEVDEYFRPVRAAVNLGEAAKTQYFEGNIDIAETRLNEERQELAGRQNCQQLFDQIDRRMARIKKLRETLHHVDRAIEACHVAAMVSMSRQLEGQQQVLLQQKKADLDRIMVPASTAFRRNEEAWPLFQSGQVVAAQTRLEQALDQLDQIERIDRSLCIPLRRQVEARLDETDRIRSTLVLVDSALANCNFADIDLLMANLANATHVSLERALQDLKAGRSRCGLSDDEKLAQAEQTCRSKHPNSIVDEFNPQTGRYTCVCPDDYMWDPANAACASRTAVQEASNRICESGYANSVAVNIRAPNQFECNCREGYVWNEQETGCVSADIVVQNAVEACAAEGGYPAEIEGAGRYTCCPTGTVWNRSRRECTTSTEVQAAATGGDPECRWIANTTDAKQNEYICTCKPAELCGPNPNGSTDGQEASASNGAPAAAGEGSQNKESAAGTNQAEQPQSGFVNRIKKMFGDIF